MRHLIDRERALACFAMKYDCVLDQEQADFLAELEGKDREELMLNAPRRAHAQRRDDYHRAGRGGAPLLLRRPAWSEDHDHQ